MTFTEEILVRVSNLNKNVVFPEGTDHRILEATEKLLQHKIVRDVILLGKEKEILQKIEENLPNLKKENLKIIEPEKYQDIDQFTQEFYELRKHKGMTLDKARELIVDPLNFGAMMVRKDLADTSIAGALYATADVLRAGLNIIKTKPNVSTVSSAFIIEFLDKNLGNNGLMLFSDCAVIPEPTSLQLSEIAMQTAQTCREVLEIEPIIAMLSFSTKGSAKYHLVDKVTEALEIVRKKEPNLIIDGEMQLDAAIVKEVAELKCPTSKVKGNANILIFPDLQSGNIGYKMAQRLGNAKAYGPFLQGFNKPISDLSRGCNAGEIINTTAITLLGAEATLTN